MTDPFAAVMWSVVAALFVANGVYSCLMAHAKEDALLAALSWMFLSLAVGTGLIAGLRSGWEILPLSHLKVIERTAFIIAAVDGAAVVWMLTGGWEQSERMRRFVRRWNHLMEGVL